MLWRKPRLIKPQGPWRQSCPLSVVLVNPRHKNLCINMEITMQHRVLLPSYMVFIVLFGHIVSACGGLEAPANPRLNTTGVNIVEGSPEALGLLAFINHISTTYDVLDQRVPLESRAAQHIITHRNGKDGLFPSTDDRLFTHIGQLDAVELVGPSAIEHLLNFALAHGWYPVNNDVLGVFDEVTISYGAADTILTLVNTASRQELDQVVGLNILAVESILLARPIQSMDALAKLYFVGTNALEILKGYVTPKTGYCLGYNDCSSDLICAGMSYDEYYLPGKCVDAQIQIGENTPCTAEQACLGTLNCIGIEESSAGWCAQAWKTARLEQHDSTPLTFKHGDTTPSHIFVSGLATYVVELRIELNIEHDAPESIGILLKSPQGGIFEIASGLSSTILAHIVTTVPHGLEANGAWTLLVSSQNRAQTGILQNWSITLSSDWQ